jgi:hypothetical protein
MFMRVVNRKSVNKLDFTWKQSFLMLDELVVSLRDLELLLVDLFLRFEKNFVFEVLGQP